MNSHKFAFASFHASRPTKMHRFYSHIRRYAFPKSCFRRHVVLSITITKEITSLLLLLRRDLPQMLMALSTKGRKSLCMAHVARHANVRRSHFRADFIFAQKTEDSMPRGDDARGPIRRSYQVSVSVNRKRKEPDELLLSRIAWPQPFVHAPSVVSDDGVDKAYGTQAPAHPTFLSIVPCDIEITYHT